jgi:hypothetical protein
VVTLWNGRIFIIYDLRAPTSSQHISNVSGGGVPVECDVMFSCPDISEDARTVLQELTALLANVHHRRLPKIISIGWDVMLDCTADGRASAYVLEGNIFHGAVFRAGSTQNRAAEYKRIAREYVHDMNDQE